MSPISIGKDKRFKEVKAAGSSVPFYDVREAKEKIDDAEFKNGWGFGFSKRKVFDASKIAYIPSPDTYYGPWMSNFKNNKDPKKCTFGEPYENIRARVEMENPKIHTKIEFENVGPVTYTPLTSVSKKQSFALSCRPKLPLIEEVHRLKQPNVSPDNYSVKDELVKSTRFSKVHAGGTSPKDGIVFNKNPGPGEYLTCNNISDIAQSKAHTQSSSFASTMGKSWYS